MILTNNEIIQIAFVIVTAAYAFISYHLLITSKKQLELAERPILHIEKGAPVPHPTDQGRINATVKFKISVKSFTPAYDIKFVIKNRDSLPIIDDRLRNIPVMHNDQVDDFSVTFEDKTSENYEIKMYLSLFYNNMTGKRYVLDSTIKLSGTGFTPNILKSNIRIID